MWRLRGPRPCSPHLAGNSEAVAPITVPRAASPPPAAERRHQCVRTHVPLIHRVKGMLRFCVFPRRTGCSLQTHSRAGLLGDGRAWTRVCGPRRSQVWPSSSTTGFTDLVCTAFSQGTRLHWVLLPLPCWGSLRVLQTCGQGIHESNYFNNTKTSRGFSLLWSFLEAAWCATLERTTEARRSAIQPDLRLSTPNTEPTLLRKAHR